MGSRPGIRNYRFSFNLFITPAVQWLIVANVAVYIFELLLQTFSGPSAYNWFVHAFGRVLEVAWGRNKFLQYYFLTGVGAGLINVIVKTVPLFWGQQPSDVATIGASGAIFGVLLACAILFPDRQVIMFPIPIKMSMRTFVIVMTALEFLGTFGLGGDNISHICHLGGMVIGYVYLRRGSFLYSVRNSVSDWKLQRNRKRFQVYMNKQKEPPSRPDRWVN